MRRAGGPPGARPPGTCCTTPSGSTSGTTPAGNIFESFSGEYGAPVNASHTAWREPVRMIASRAPTRVRSSLGGADLEVIPGLSWRTRGTGPDAGMAAGLPSGSSSRRSPRRMPGTGWINWAVDPCHRLQCRVCRGNGEPANGGPGGTLRQGRRVPGSLPGKPAPPNAAQAPHPGAVQPVPVTVPAGAGPDLGAARAACNPGRLRLSLNTRHGGHPCPS